MTRDEMIEANSDENGFLSPLDCLALASYDACVKQDGTARGLSQEPMATHRAIVRAVLAEMRIPTRAMIDAAYALSTNWPGDEPPLAFETWVLIVDHLRGDPPLTHEKMDELSTGFHP